MNVNELRIGNYVWDDYGGIMIVSQIGDGFVDCKKENHLPSGRYDIDSIKPVVIDENWLLKFGFYRPNGFINGLWFETSIVGIEKGWLQKEVKLMFRYIDYNIEFWDYSCHFKSKIKYVHQIQNLCFALTGDELNLKP